MNDTYVELLVKAPYKKTMVYLKYAIQALGILFILGAFFVHPLLLILGVAILACSGIPMKFDGVEYEYLYMDKELSIEKIFHQERRSKVGDYKLSTLECMAPVGSDRLALYSKDIKTEDYSSKNEEANPYEMIFVNGNNKKRLIIDTTEELVDAMRGSFPRAVFKK